MIEVKNVSHSFGKETVLKEINLIINKGEIFGILGPSGAGKTTLVKFIAGILESDKGEVRINDENMPSLELMEKIGYMAQSDALYEELSANENLHFFASLYGLKKQQRIAAMNRVLSIVDLSDHVNKTTQEYSGGMKRRLSLAIALLHHPTLIILDEPTVGIDPVLRGSIWDELKKLAEEGMTIIVTTHVMDEAEKCHRIAMLRDGRIIACDTPENLKASKGAATMEEAFLAFGGGEK